MKGGSVGVEFEDFVKVVKQLTAFELIIIRIHVKYYIILYTLYVDLLKTIKTN